MSPSAPVNNPAPTDAPRGDAGRPEGEAGAGPAAGTKDTGQKTVGRLAVRGMVWTTGQTIGSKVVAVLQQLIIAKYFLSEEDFGLVATGQVVISLLALGQSLGVAEILIRRQKHFRRWVQAAFWLNLSAGFIGMLMVLAIIPLWGYLFRAAAWVFGKSPEVPHVQGILAVWSLFLLLDAVSAIFMARLRIDMRFRLLAALGTFNIAGQAVLSLVLAAMGWGAYSVVIPIPVMALINLAAAYRAAGLRIGMAPEFKKWGYFLRDSRYFLLNNLFSTLLLQADYLLTGLFFNQKILGAYYWAYRMSTQTAQLVGANLGWVMLPSFAKLNHDPPRQTAAYERTCAALLLIGLPVCFLQALLAEPVFHLIFGSKWDRAIPLFQVLSLGMGFMLPNTTATVLLLAQGRYRTNTLWLGFSALMFILSVLAGALYGSVLSVAYFVAGYFAFFGPIAIALPVARQVSTVRFTMRIYWFPTLASVASLSLGLLLGRWLPWGGNAGQIVVRTAGWALAVAGLLALLRPTAAREVGQRLRGMLASRLGKSESANPAGESPPAGALHPGTEPAHSVAGAPATARKNIRSAKVVWVIHGDEVFGERRAIMSLMKGLAAAGWKPEALSVSGGECADALRRAGLPVTEFGFPPLPSMHRASTPLGRVWEATKLAMMQRKISRRVEQEIRDRNADAVHVLLQNVLPAVGAAAQRMGRPCFWEMIGIVGNRYPLEINRKMLGWQVRKYGIRPLANSHYTAKSLGEVGVPVKVMYLGADSSRFDASREFAITRARMGIPKEAVVFVIAARMDASKGQARFLEAMLGVPRDDLHLMLVGGSPESSERKQMEAVAAQAGASGRLHWVPFTEEPEAYIALADVAVNARIDAEPFGLSTVEAMTMGKPLLVHALGGPAETVVDGESGWHVKEATVEALRSGIERALQERDRWQEMGAAAMHRAKTHFAIEKQTAWYCAVVSDAITQMSQS